MSNWFFDDDKRDQVVETAVVTGWFECQECGVATGKATYDEDAGKLRWKCRDGHKSEMDFEL